MIGIYKITNKINKKMYIGQSIDIERRIKQHLVYCVQDNTAIHNAIKKYGADNFDWEIIEECTLNELDTKEQFWINYYNTYNTGYNETRGGQNKQHYVDYDKIKEIFLKTRNIQQTAIEVGCDRSTVSRALKMLNIDIKQIKKQQKIPISKKRILQLDSNFNIINSFSSQKEVIEYLKCSRQGLSKALNQKITLKGFYWKYDDGEVFIPAPSSKQFGRYDISTKQLLSIHHSYREALENIGIEYNDKNKVLLSKIITGIRKNNIVFGFLWSSI